MRLLVRRERRSRIGSEQNLDESKGSLFQSFEHFRKARVILRLLIVITNRNYLRREDEIYFWLLGVFAQLLGAFCRSILCSSVELCYCAVVLDLRRN